MCTICLSIVFAIHFNFLLRGLILPGSGNLISSIQVGLLLFPAVVSKGHWGKILLEVGTGFSHRLPILLSVETYLFHLGPTFLTTAPGLSCLSDFQELIIQKEPSAVLLTYRTRKNCGVIYFYFYASSRTALFSAVANN